MAKAKKKTTTKATVVYAYRAKEGGDVHFLPTKPKAVVSLMGKTLDLVDEEIYDVKSGYYVVVTGTVKVTSAEGVDIEDANTDESTESLCVDGFERASGVYLEEGQFVKITIGKATSL